MQHKVTTIYLDQNVLSDLRKRKLEESKNEAAKKLKQLLMSKRICLAYSFVNLNEILQIGREDYQVEHIDLLDSLGALYIRPLDGVFLSVDPYQNWKEYKENEVSNRMLGIDHASSSLELLSRKLSGLKENRSFDELSQNLSSSVISLLNNALEEAGSIDFNELSESKKRVLEKLKLEILSLKEKTKNLEPFPIDSDTELGPKTFREHFPIQNLEQLQPSGVIPAILEEFERLSKQPYQWFPLGGDPVAEKISGCYELMNLAGYYADDFTRVKKGKDRFKASKWDMMHASNARFCNFLISNDVRFLNKASACYSYLDVKTKAYLLFDFVKEYLQDKCL